MVLGEAISYREVVPSVIKFHYINDTLAKELCVKVMQTTVKINHLKGECRLTANYDKSTILKI